MGTYEGSQNRLDRIEEKIDKLSETVISLARAEEKLMSLERSNTLVMQTLVKVDERIDRIEDQTKGVISMHQNVSKGIWAIIIGALTAGVSAFFASR